MDPSTSPSDQLFHTSSTTTPTKRRRTTRHRSTVRSETDHSSSSTTATHHSDFQDHSTAIITSLEEDMAANCLILLSKGGPTYECKTCSRVFHSFQALGGHRASHKKTNNYSRLESTPAVRSPPPLPSSSSHDDHDHDHDETNGPMRIKTNVGRVVVRVHECSICGSEFSSGQALGGHMRRHRPPQLPTPSNLNRPIEVESSGARSVLALDLNLPAPHDDEISLFHDHVFTSTPALVDCHY